MLFENYLERYLAPVRVRSFLRRRLQARAIVSMQSSTKCGAAGVRGRRSGSKSRARALLSDSEPAFRQQCQLHFRHASQKRIIKTQADTSLVHVAKLDTPIYKEA